MTPTHKPEDGDRAPISNGGAELERFNVTEHFDPFDDASYGVMAASEGGAWVKLADATALLVEKVQRIERLEARLAALDNLPAEDFIRKVARQMGPPPFDTWPVSHVCQQNADEALELVEEYDRIAALSQPHPHGG